LQRLRIPSFKEIRFRLKQEAANLWLFARPVPPAAPRWHSLPLPTASSLRSLVQADPAVGGEILALAQRIRGGDLPVFDEWVPTGGEIRWRRDWVNGKETGTSYFRRIPYLDIKQCGDHKFIWEINRHQHLVTLAQAWIADGDPAWLRAIEEQIESWLQQNPPQRGINWASALEVAFRALSWLWILHWAHDALSEPFRRKLLQNLYLHGRHLAANLSVYFSPNTHLLGEAAVLHAIGLALGQKAWQETGARVLNEELDRQVLSDGAHFERSSYYHVYALDFFLLHALLSRRTETRWKETIGRMTVFLQHLLSPDGTIPLLGDDDGGRLFHPYGPRRSFGEATVATALAWMGQPLPAALSRSWGVQGVWWLGTAPEAVPSAMESPSWRHFPASGLVAWRGPEGTLLFDGGGFGALSAGHSHADALSLILRHRGADVLLDPGTFSYMSEDRNRFRASSAHNTIHAGPGQAVPAGPFSWQSRPVVEIEVSSDGRQCHGVCRSGEIVHHRQVCLAEERFLWVVDTVYGPAGMPATQTWMTAAQPVGKADSFLLCGNVTVALAGGEVSIEEAACSPVYGKRLPCWSLRQSTVSLPSTGPWIAAAVFDLEAKAEGPLRVAAGPEGVRLEWEGRVCIFQNTQST